MAFAKALLVFIGLGLMTKKSDAAISGVGGDTFTVVENTLTGNIGTVTVTGTPTASSITSQPTPEQFAISTAGVLTLNTGYTLDYETAASLLLVVQMSDADPSSASGTVTITVSDVYEEFDNTIMFSCVSMSTAAAGTAIVTKAASKSDVTAAYTIASQVPAGLLTMNAATGALSVATTKALTAAIPASTVNIQLVSTAPAATTSNAALTIGYGCSSSSATMLVGSFTLMLAMMAAFLQ